jgi:hypothetical protein
MAHQRLLRGIGYVIMVLALLGGQVGAATAVRAAPTPLAAPPTHSQAASLDLGLGLNAVTAVTAGAPESVDIAGPGTVEVMEESWYTAEVLPDTASLPITITWVTDGVPAFYELRITRRDPVSRSITFAEPGTNYITVTATNDLGSATHVRKVWVAPPPQPDLTVTDITYDYNTDILYYQFMNAGDETVDQAFTVRTYIGDSLFAEDRITRVVEPGLRLTRMVHAVPCNGASSTYRVVIDVLDEIPESNEANNERSETWVCDPYPPKITQLPSVSVITQSQATIRWQTNEDASSLVLYGTRRGAFNLSAPSRPTAFTQNHQVVLSGLSPGTTYEYKVRSADAAGNVVESRPATFETAPPTIPAPPTPELRLVRDPDHRGGYLLEAVFDDASGVASVEFLLNGESVGTDYGNQAAPPRAFAQGNEEQQVSPLDLPTKVYRAPIVPLTLGYTRATFLSKADAPVLHTVTARVTTFERISSHISQQLQAFTTSQPLTVDLNILSPPPDHKLYIVGGATPAGTVVPLHLNATQYDWNCEHTPSGTIVDCAEVMRAVQEVKVYLENQLVAELTPSGPQHYDLQTTLDLSGRIPSSYQVRVRAFDSEGSSYQAETYITVVQLQPSLDVTREVTRFGNRFRVRLTVHNLPGATGTAKLTAIKDYVRSFQVAASHETGYRVAADYTPAGGADARQTAITIDFPARPGQVYLLPVGESAVFEYWVVPALYEDDTVYEIGHKHLHINYLLVSGEARIAAFDRKQLLLQEPVRQAIQAADYLIVTHPANLRFTDDAADVNALLMAMADLARLKAGVVGYLDTDDSWTLHERISEGGAWAERMSPAFLTVGEGYLLFVGEDHIVPTFYSPSYNVSLTDQPYSNTGGSSAPDLVLGRIIGEKAADLIKPLQASIDVYLGEAEFDRSHAWLFTGGGTRQEVFAEDVDTIQNLLYNDVGITAHFKAKAIDYHPTGQTSYDFRSGDDFALGFVSGGAKADGVVGDRLNDQITLINPITGVPSAYFAQTFDSGDRLAVGNVQSTGHDEIVMGDVSSGNIHVFGAGDPVSFKPGSAYGFYDSSHLALGDVTGNGLENILVGLPGSPGTSGELYVYTGTGARITNAGFSFDFGAYDGLAAGNLMPGFQDEIVIAKGSYMGSDESEIHVYDKDGEFLASMAYPYSTYSQIAVGNVWSGNLRAEIVIMERLTRYIYVYHVDTSEGLPGTIKEVHRMYIPWLTGNEILVLGDVEGDGLEEIVIAGKGADIIVRYDPYYCNRLLPEVQPQTPGKDILFYAGHGSPGSWGCVTEFPYGFGTTRPVAWGGYTCLSGNYSGSGVAEAFFDQNGAVFIGATEIVWSTSGTASTERFFKSWGNESAGRALLDLERHYWNWSNKWNFWIYENNLYGDPKFGQILLPGLAADTAPATPPPATLTLNLPPLEIASADGIDTVTIPEGDLWRVDGDPQVPIWRASYEVPAGMRVQEIVMDSRSGLEEHTGWVLPLTTDFIVSAGPSVLSAVAATTTDAVVPSPDVPFAWHVHTNPDGSSTLELTVYPFFYHPLSAESQYYRDYTFTITTLDTAVAVTRLTTGQPVYEPGDPVSVDLGIQNEGAALDVVVEAEIQDLQGDIISGLLLRSLHDLSGPVVFAPAWDSTGTPPGDYHIVVKLRDAEGALLDHAERRFRLGTLQGQIDALTVDPMTFAGGPLFDIELVFANTGSLPITGTAVVQVHPAAAGGALAVMTTTLTNVLPGATATFSPTWNATGQPDQDYRISGYVTYGGGGTPVVAIELPLAVRVYLPVTLRR